MKLRIILFTVMVSFFGFGKSKAQSDQSAERSKGTIGRYYEDKLPVIVSFANELPAIEIREKFSSLTVVSWKYDGSTNNGMPPPDVNEKLIKLEDAMNETMDKSNRFVNAYNRTGNNLKEFVYYSNGLDDFMPLLNDALKGHETYPIEINFYEDPDWSELKKLLEDFKGK